MKKLAHILLFLALAALLYDAVGGFVQWSARFATAQSEALQQPAKRQQWLTLVDADVATGQLVYLGTHEVKYKGNLYDIVATDHVDGATRILVVHDQQEEGLLAELRDHIDQWLASPFKSGKKQAAKPLNFLKDFVPANKPQLICCPSSAVVYTTISYPVITTTQAVADNPPQLI